jgi:hypothetical protein
MRMLRGTAGLAIPAPSSRLDGGGGDVLSNEPMLEYWSAYCAARRSRRFHPLSHPNLLTNGGVTERPRGFQRVAQRG